MSKLPVWWLSFADPERGGGLGVAIVEAEDPRAAIKEAWRLALNPGGEVALQCVPRAKFEHCIGKFFTIEEIKATFETVSGKVSDFDQPVQPVNDETVREFRERAKAEETAKSEAELEAAAARRRLN